MHVLPQLRRLEEKYPNELAVVGVHSGKFHAERSTANIRQAVLRLEIEHPVVNDRAFRVWRSYEVSAWPTLALIDPLGHYVDSHSGEIRAEDFEPVIAGMVRRFEALGHLERRPLAFRPERRGEPERPLAFPGKVLAEGERLFIADTGHHRVLIARLREAGRRAEVEDIIGCGEAGMEDDVFADASLRHPQGMALQGEVLYIADIGNHAIRAADLARRQVETIAGTGEQSRHYGLVPRSRDVALNSPWDLTVRGRSLYIAMAGAHQIWSLDLDTQEAGPLAGNGREALQDGLLGQASLAQPSGLATGDGRLYCADSESSAIRFLDLGPGAAVHTVVGTGLFDFGDKDGVADAVRLQHPYGLAWHEGLLYVADTYNNKIKIVDPAGRSVRMIAGGVNPEPSGGPDSPFWEPQGIAAADGRLYIADTNHHRIQACDLASSDLSTLALDGL